VREIAPHGKAAKIAGLLKKQGYVPPFESLSAGRGVIAWYNLPKGANLASGGPKPVPVAAGKATFSYAGALNIAIELTAEGKRMSEDAKRLPLTAQRSSTAAAQPAVVAPPFHLPRRLARCSDTQDQSAM
jgi:hypothetical protein